MHVTGPKSPGKGRQVLSRSALPNLSSHLPVPYPFPRTSTGDLACMQPGTEQLQAPHKAAALEGHINAVAKMSQIISYFVLENDGVALMTWQMHY